VFFVNYLKEMTKFVFLFSVILVSMGCNKSLDQNVIITAIDNFPDGLDPARDYGITETHIINNIYESLVVLNDDYETISEGLSNSWQISESRMTYRFHLIEGIRFHDESPLTAKTVAYAFQRQIHLNPDAPLFNMIKNIRVIDSLMLEIELNHVYTPFLYALTASTGLKAISQAALEVHGDNISHSPSGTGPFKIEIWNDKDYVTIEHVPQKRHPFSEIKRVIYKYYPEYFEGEASLRNGNSDIKVSVAGYSIDRLKWQGIINYAVGKPFSTVFLGMNTQDKILSDQRVRRAILCSIDIPNLVHNVLRGNSLVAKGPLPPGFNIGKLPEQEKYNLDIARNLKDSAGYPKPLTLKFFYLDRYRARKTGLEMMEKNLEKIGILLEKVPFYSWEALNSACRSDSAQLFWMAWEADMYGDPENFLYSLFYSQSRYNFFQYENPTVDSLLQVARQEANRKIRDLLYQHLIREILAGIPAVWLYHPFPIYAYNQEKIYFLPVDPYNNIHYNQIRLNN
jgi:peptide/nickel transport system substrate-binding protein